VVISEINYNPTGSTDATEFIELLNAGGTPAALNGAHFTEGIEYRFADVTLAPGQTFVLVRDSAAFTAAYPGVAVGGVFTGALDNGGDTLTLKDIAERVIFTVTYGDSTAAGWAADADGNGSTLVLRRPFFTTTDPMQAGSWRASSRAGGNPGAADSTVFSGIASNDADKDGFPALTEYALGTSDTNAASRPKLDISRDANGTLRLSFLHPETADDVTVEALESTDLSQWSVAAPDSETAASPGWMRSTWRANTLDTQGFLKLRVRQE
jgi:hypothetical protein